MSRDFDDFDDEHEYIRLTHYDQLDHDQYGEDYDPNADHFYDLDVFSLEYAKSLFHGLGNQARYKGFNGVGHKCRNGVQLGCNADELKRFDELREKIGAAYGNQPFDVTDTGSFKASTDPEIIALEAEFELLSEKCLFGECEPCTKAEYLDYIDKMNGLEQDGADALYQPNNQTILDANTMPDVPVDPKAFIARVSAELRSKNVLISDDMPGVLEQMCRLFNFSINPNQTLPRTIKNLVYPAQTGIGKSVSVQVYVSMLEQHSSVIIVSKVEEAVQYCNYINQLSGDPDYARCYYAITDKNKDDPMRVEVLALKNHRCIVITHNMFRRIDGFDGIEYFSHYNDKLRDFVSIDEKLSFFEAYKLGYKQLDKLIQNVEEALEQSAQLKQLKNSHEVLLGLKTFKAFLLDKDDKIITDSNSVVVRDHFVKQVKDDIIAIGEKIQLSERSEPFKYPIKLEGLQNKQAVLDLLHSHHIRTQSRKRIIKGVSFAEAHFCFKGFDEIDPFYCERLDPKLNNCQPRPVKNPILDDPRLELLGDKYDADFYKKMQPLMNKAREEEVSWLGAQREAGFYDEDGMSLLVSILKVMLEVRVDELLQSLESLGANKNNSYRQNTLNKINELMLNLKYFSNKHFLIYKTNYETALLATENLTNQLGLSVMLDATAQINEYYQLANRFLGHVGFVPAPQIRQFKNLTINKAKGFSQSRSAIYKDKEVSEVQAIAQSYASYVISELNDGDKMLVVCHKGFLSAMKEQLSDKRVVFTHWGNHVGRNDWSDCNKVMLIGWYYQNPTQAVLTINSSLDSVLLTSRYLDESLMENFEISQLADDIVQGLMRSQARNIASADSDCKPTNFYLFYQDDEKSKRVLELVESQFPQATVVDWIPKGNHAAKKKRKPQKNADKIIELLIAKSANHETYLRKDVEEELNINKTTMTRILQGEYFKEKLAAQGFVLKNKDGKSQEFIL